MKCFPIKLRFSVSKILLLVIGAISFVGVVFFPKTFSTYYTAFSFSNEFLSAKKYSGYSNTVYADFLSSDDPDKKTFCIANTSDVSDDNSNYQYIRVAHIECLIINYMNSDGSYVPLSNSESTISPYVTKTDDEENGLSINAKWFKQGDWYYYKPLLPTGGEIKILDLKRTEKLDTGDIDKFYTTLVVESLPADANDADFQSAWGVSKTELENLGLGKGETAS